MITPANLMDRFEELTRICEELAAGIRAAAGDPIVAAGYIATFERVNATRLELGAMLNLKPAGVAA